MLPSANLHEVLNKQKNVARLETEGFMNVSIDLMPKETKDIFALRTTTKFKNDDKWIDEGSYIFVNPHDRLLGQGRLMVFCLDSIFDMRKVSIGEAGVWLQRVSSNLTTPMILTKEDAFKFCVGHVFMIFPKP